MKGFLKETDYCATKFGLEGFTKSLAMELEGRGISVNTLSPGGLKGRVRIKPTSVTQEQFDALSPEEQAKWDDPIVLTEAFVYLALSRNRGVTGQRIYAYDLSEEVRQNGWEIDYHPQMGG